VVDCCFYCFRLGYHLPFSFAAQGLRSHGTLISITISRKSPSGTTENSPAFSTPGKHKKQVASRRDACTHLKHGLICSWGTAQLSRHCVPVFRLPLRVWNPGQQSRSHIRERSSKTLAQ